MGGGVLKVILRERLRARPGSRTDSSALPHPVRPVPVRVAAPPPIKAITGKESHERWDANGNTCAAV